MAGFSYKGTKKIKDVLEYDAVDQQLRKLEQFDQFFIDEMSGAMGEAVETASAHAKEDLNKKIKGISTGELEGSIYGKLLSASKANMQVRGMIGTKEGMKAFVQEAGRWYGGGKSRYFWKGKFYLYYGAKDKANEIMAQYQAANDRIVQKLVVK